MTMRESKNHYPIFECTIFPEIQVKIENDQQLVLMLNAPDYVAQRTAQALVWHFFPESTEEQVKELIFRFSITGRKPEEFETLKNFYYQQKEKKEQEAKEEAQQKELEAQLKEQAEKLKALEAKQQQTEAQNQRRPNITQAQAAAYIMRAEDAARVVNRSPNIDSVIRRVQTWDLYIKSNGEKGICPPANYSRRKPPEAFALWARDFAEDEKYNNVTRDNQETRREKAEKKPKRRKNL